MNARHLLTIVGLTFLASGCAVEEEPESQEANATAKENAPPPSSVSSLDIDEAAIAWANEQRPDLVPGSIAVKRWLLARVLERLSALDQAMADRGGCLDSLGLSISFSDNPDAREQTAELAEVMSWMPFPVSIGESPAPDAALYEASWASPTAADGSTAPWYGHIQAFHGTDGAAYIPLDHTIPPLYQTIIGGVLLSRGAPFDQAVSDAQGAAHPVEVETEMPDGTIATRLANRFEVFRGLGDFEAITASELLFSDDETASAVCNTVVVGGFGEPADGKFPPHRAHAQLVDRYVDIVLYYFEKDASESE